jgi:hypothetical protein
LIDVVFGPMSCGETTLAPRVFAGLRAGMLLLADRGFDTDKVIAAAVASPAELLIRIKTLRTARPVARPFPDGSYLAVVGGVVLRIVQAQVGLHKADGTVHTETWRLATTVTDHRLAPARELIECYHRRWEVETAFLGLKVTILRGRILRSRSPELLDQEIWALLCLYQLLTSAISLALAGTGLDRSRGSFHEAVHAARDQIIRAQGRAAKAGMLLPVIGDRIRRRPVDRRGPRTGPRSVKRPISKYAYKDLGAAKTTQKAVIGITIIELHPEAVP